MRKVPFTVVTEGAQVSFGLAQPGSEGSALPTDTQWVRSVEEMIWMFPATEFVA